MNVISIILSGVFFFLSLYHFFIWIWQRNDKLNFSLIKLCIVIMSYHVLRIVFPDNGADVLLLIYISTAFCIVFPHIALTLRLYPDKFRWLHITGTALVVASGIAAGVLVTFLGNFWYFSLGFFGIVLLYAIPANLVVLKTFLQLPHAISGETRIQPIIYLLLVISAMLSGFVSGFPGLANFPLLGAVLFNGPFLAIMFVYGFMLLKRQHSLPETAISENAMFNSLPNRQRMLITLLRQGKTRKEICGEMNITMNTLKTHFTRMFEKFKVENRVELLNVFSREKKPKAIQGARPQSGSPWKNYQ